MDKKEKAPRIISDATLDRYLCAILILSAEQPLVRAVDVAGHLGYSKACVSMAVKQMTREGLVTIGRHSSLELTETGSRRAGEHSERLRYFQSLLRQSGVEDADAILEASALTRALSGSSFEALRRYLSGMGVPEAE